MGGTIRIGAIRSDHCEVVFESLVKYFSACERPVVDAKPPLNVYPLFEQSQGWVVLRYLDGLDWDHFREMQLFVSAELETTTLLAFIDDGDYWALEAAHRGKIISNFVQWPDPVLTESCFPGRPSDGNPAGLAALFPDVEPGIIASYLVRDPGWLVPENADAETQQRADQ